MHPHRLLLCSAPEPTAALGVLRASTPLRSQYAASVVFVDTEKLITIPSQRKDQDSRTRTAVLHYYCCTPKLLGYSTTPRWRCLCCFARRRSTLASPPGLPSAGPSTSATPPAIRSSTRDRTFHDTATRTPPCDRRVGRGRVYSAVRRCCNCSTAAAVLHLVLLITTSTAVRTDTAQRAPPTAVVPYVAFEFQRQCYDMGPVLI